MAFGKSLSAAYLNIFKSSYVFKQHFLKTGPSLAHLLKAFILFLFTF